MMNVTKHKNYFLPLVLIFTFFAFLFQTQTVFAKSAQPSDYLQCKEKNLNDNLLPHLSTLAANAECNPKADVRTFLEDGICYMECTDTATGVGNLYKVFKSGSEKRKIACAYCGGAVPRKEAKTTYKHDSTGKAVGIIKFEEGSSDCTFNSYESSLSKETGKPLKDDDTEKERLKAFYYFDKTTGNIRKGLEPSKKILKEQGLTHEQFMKKHYELVLPDSGKGYNFIDISQKQRVYFLNTMNAKGDACYQSVSIDPNPKSTYANNFKGPGMYDAQGHSKFATKTYLKLLEANPNQTTMEQVITGSTSSSGSSSGSRSTSSSGEDSAN